MHRFDLCTVFVFLCVSVLLSGCEQDIPEGWRLFKLDKAFSFSAPDSVRAQDGQVVDSIAATLRDERIEIEYDYGWYSSSLMEFDDQLIGSRNGSLDGKPARFIETTNLVAVHVPAVIDRIRFTMIVRFARPEHREVGRAVIASVRFQSR